MTFFNQPRWPPPSYYNHHQHLFRFADRNVLVEVDIPGMQSVNVQNGDEGAVHGARSRSSHVGEAARTCEEGRHMHGDEGRAELVDVIQDAIQDAYASLDAYGCRKDRQHALGACHHHRRHRLPFQQDSYHCACLLHVRSTVFLPCSRPVTRSELKYENGINH
jgi:hypothetical protein